MKCFSDGGFFINVYVSFHQRPWRITALSKTRCSFTFSLASVICHCNRKDVSGAHYIEDLFDEVVTTHVRCHVFLTVLHYLIVTFVLLFGCRDQQRSYPNHAPQK